MDCKQIDKPVIRISVRNMVEFLLRSGDIKSSGYIGIQGLRQGAKIHRKLQKEMEEGYQPEVRLSYDISFDDFILTVDGIADGIITIQDEVIIDEIKSTFYTSGDGGTAVQSAPLGPGQMLCLDVHGTGRHT